jgi:predicted ATPase
VTQLKTLGRLRLERTSFTRPTPLLLLGYLSLEGSQQRKHLAELFWQEGNRMKSLSMTLTRLRQGAGEVIEADDKQARATLKSDAQELLESLDKSEWQQANELYTGAFLEGVVIEDWSTELEEWVYTTREYLAERVQYALLNLAEDAAKRQEFDKVRELSERAYKLPGLSGTDITNLKRLYPLLSAASSLLAPEVRKELEGYGIIVSLSREEAKAKFRAEKRTSGLPTRQTSFVGRESELGKVAALLTKVQLLTLLGTAGVGKTRLALQLAHEQQKLNSFEGVYFVSLESLNSSDLIVPTILGALGLTQQSQTDPLAQLVDFIAARSILLVLDNLEHLTQNVNLLSNLIRQCPNLKVLATSRERLNLEEEHLFPLEGLDFPPVNATFDEAKDVAAVTLFSQRAQQLQPQFDLRGQLAAVLKICKLVEGLPLGLELAASWTRLMSCQEIAAEIGRGLEFLATTTRNVPERHRSLKAAFDYSWKLLSPKEQEVLRKLSVFVGGFRREAASEVAGATIPLLASLVDKSLLKVLPNGRYDRHPLLYQFTQEKLAENQQEESATRKQHGHHFLNFLVKFKGQLEGSKEQETRRAIQEEVENVRASWLTIITSADEANLMTASQSLLSYFVTTGQTQQGLNLFRLGRQQLETFPEPAHPSKHTILRYAETSFIYWLGGYNEAFQGGLELLHAFDTLGDIHSSMNTCQLLGRAALRLGNYDDAHHYLEQGLALAKNLANDSALAESWRLLATIADQRGKFTEAKQYNEQALILYRRLGNTRSQVIIANNLGNACLGSGELNEAKRYFEEGLNTAKHIEFQAIIPYFLYNLAVIAKRQEAYEASESYCLEALTLTRTTHDKSLEASILGMLGVIKTKLNKEAEAYAYLKESLIVARDISDLPVLLENLLYVAEWHEQQGNVSDAVALASLVARHTASTGNNRTLAVKLCQRVRSEAEQAVSSHDESSLDEPEQMVQLESLLKRVLNTSP